MSFNNKRTRELEEEQEGTIRSPKRVKHVSSRTQEFVDMVGKFVNKYSEEVRRSLFRFVKRMSLEEKSELLEEVDLLVQQLVDEENGYRRDYKRNIRYYLLRYCCFRLDRKKFTPEDVTQCIQDWLANRDQFNDSHISARRLGVILFNVRGNLHIDMKEFEKAIADYSMALSLDPSYISALYNRGLAKYRTNEYAAAEQDLSQVLSVEPAHLDALLIRGKLNFKQNKLALCISDMTLVLTTDPDNLIALKRRGSSFFKLSRYADAINDYSVILQKESCPTTHLNRAKCYINLGQELRAVTDAKIGCALKPKSYKLHPRIMDLLHEVAQDPLFEDGTDDEFDNT